MEHVRRDDEDGVEPFGMSRDEPVPVGLVRRDPDTVLVEQLGRSRIGGGVRLADRGDLGIVASKDAFEMGPGITPTPMNPTRVGACSVICRQPPARR